MLREREVLEMAGARILHRMIQVRSGEEVSVSLLFSRTIDRLNTPHPCIQEEAPRKTKWVPEQSRVKKQNPAKRKRTQKRRQKPLLYETRGNKSVKTPQ